MDKLIVSNWDGHGHNRYKNYLQSMQLMLYLQVLHTFSIKATTHVSTLQSMQLVRGESSLIEVLEGLLKVRHELSIRLCLGLGSWN